MDRNHFLRVAAILGLALCNGEVMVGAIQAIACQCANGLYASENPRSLTLLPFDRIVAVDATNLPIDKGAAEPRTARLRVPRLSS